MEEGVVASRKGGKREGEKTEGSKDKVLGREGGSRSDGRSIRSSMKGRGCPLEAEV